LIIYSQSMGPHSCFWSSQCFRTCTFCYLFNTTRYRQTYKICHIVSIIFIYRRRYSPATHSGLHRPGYMTHSHPTNLSGGQGLLADYNGAILMQKLHTILSSHAVSVFRNEMQLSTRKHQVKKRLFRPLRREYTLSRGLVLCSH